MAAKAVRKAVNTAIEVAATGDAIKDNAQKVFMSTTAYQEWGYVLKQNGIEISALKVGMRQFAQKVAAGDEALAKYGITATNVEEAFGQAIANIQNLGTETEKLVHRSASPGHSFEGDRIADPRTLVEAACSQHRGMRDRFWKDMHV